MTIIVTQAHFDKAQAWKEDIRKEGMYGANCLVAQAVREALPDAKVLIAGTEDLYINDVKHVLPEYLRMIIMRFDMNNYAYVIDRLPYSFNINL